MMVQYAVESCSRSSRASDSDVASSDERGPGEHGDVKIECQSFSSYE